MKKKIDNRTYGKLQRQKDFLRVFRKKACNVKKSCKAVGISRHTFYDWYNYEYKNGKENEFKTKIDEIREGLIDFAESKLALRMKGYRTTERRIKTERLKVGVDDDGRMQFKDIETESVLTEKSVAPDTTALIFYLKTKGKSRGYVEKQEIDIDAKIKIEDPVTIILPDNGR